MIYNQKRNTTKKPKEVLEIRTLIKLISNNYDLKYLG